MATTTKAVFTKADIGCYVDGVHGIYAGEHVQQLAGSHGWSGKFTPQDHDDCEEYDVEKHDEVDHGLFYDELTDEAVDFLYTLCSDDVTFGWHDGDFMLSPNICDCDNRYCRENHAEVERCDQCDDTMIQNVYCHETGCPNS